MSYRTRRWRWLGLGLALLGCVAAAWLVANVVLDSPAGPARAGGDGPVAASNAGPGGRSAVERDGNGSAQDGQARHGGDDSRDPEVVVPPAADGTDNPPPAGTDPDSDTPGGANPAPADPGDPDRGDDPGAIEPEPVTPQPEVEPQPVRPRLPRSARDPTRRELAERRRYRNGGVPSRDDLPEAAEPDEEKTPDCEPFDIELIAEPENWEAYWLARGLAAPAMVATPVVGKVIDQLTHRGLAGATVWLYTFFPATSRLDGPLLPLTVYTRADDNGVFGFALPVPGQWPDSYPKLALGVSAGGRRLVDAIALDVLRPGEPNEIGVFWAPHEPFRVQVEVSRVDSGLAVCCTGALDPLRWDARTGAEALRTFSTTPITGAVVPALGTWDPIGQPPFMTLTHSGQPQITRRCMRRPQNELTEQETGGGVPGGDSSDGSDGSDAESAIGEPFRPLVFPNDGLLTLSGTIVDANGQPVEGAVLTLSFAGQERKLFTDAWGWFSFGSLPDRRVALAVAHEQFVDESFNGLQPGSPDLKLTMRFARPKLPFRFRRTDTGEAVTEVWLRHAPINNPGKPHERVLDEVAEVRTSADGRYLVESSLPLKWLIVEAAGLVPQALPVTSSNPPDVPHDIWLQAGRALQREPRNWTAVQTEHEWHRTDAEGEPGIWSLNDDHWADYTFEAAEFSGEAAYSLVLGVKNHTYNTLPLDNEYTFEVDVFLDGQKVGRLSIPCDATVPRLARLPLGRLTGPHTVRLLWTNDRFIPGQLDANIRYERIQLVQTGDVPGEGDSGGD